MGTKFENHAFLRPRRLLPLPACPRNRRSRKRLLSNCRAVGFRAPRLPSDPRKDLTDFPSFCPAIRSTSLSTHPHTGLPHPPSHGGCMGHKRRVSKEGPRIGVSSSLLLLPSWETIRTFVQQENAQRVRSPPTWPTLSQSQGDTKAESRHPPPTPCPQTPGHPLPHERLPQEGVLTGGRLVQLQLWR